MIRKLRLQRFRGFRDVTLPLNRLTVLLGPNSSGKSTFASALVALREIQESKTGEPALAPESGRTWPVELGSYDELFHDSPDARSEGDDIGVAVELASGWVNMGFGGSNMYRAERSTPRLALTRLSLPGAPIAQSTLTTAAVPTADSEFLKVEQTAGVAASGAAPGGHTASIFERQNAEVWATDSGLKVRVLFRGIVTIAAVLSESGSAVAFETQAQLDLANTLRKLAYLRANRLTPARAWPNTKPSGVGPDGESTPQFLFHESGREVLGGSVAPPPESIAEAEEQIRAVKPWFEERREPLIDAVNHWFRYLHLADAITSAQEGGGIVLRAKMLGQERGRDLTDVGFGLSQVIPVIVAGLAVPPDGMFVVDQPESQLHPRSQAALADFFCMLLKTGRSVLVETHSEALFHRLRLRAAMDADVATGTTVYFLDAAKETCCEPRRVSLDAGGALHWPEGFLAEGVTEELAIRAILAARARDAR